MGIEITEKQMEQSLNCMWLYKCQDTLIKQSAIPIEKSHYSSTTAI